MDLHDNLGFVQLLAPQVINDTDTKSTLLDVQKFIRRAIAVSIGDCTGLDADSTLELFLQHSDLTTDASFVAVPVDEMIRDTAGLSSLTTAGLFKTLNAATEDQIVAKVEYVGIKRYIRVLLDFTTGTGGITAAPVAVVGIVTGRQMPVTAPAPVSAT